MADPNRPMNVSLAHMAQVARDALPLWDIPKDAELDLINVSENFTYLVTAPGGYKSVLRVHRQHYHSRRAIACELAWMEALRSDQVLPTPVPILGKNGKAIQQSAAAEQTEPRFFVLFEFIDGAAPSEEGDMSPHFEILGAMAARCHRHVLGWERPVPFERLTWDIDAVFGPAATWGNWRDAPGVTPDIRATLETVEAQVRARLSAYGQDPERFNLIHADMRLANLLVQGDDIRLIDFDDSGHGWFMYDFAAAISFIEDDPRIPELKAAWLRGYRQVRPLPPEDEAEIDTMIMLRRMALLAWIGTHIDAPEPQQLADGFAQTTARLGAAWLESLS